MLLTIYYSGYQIKKKRSVVHVTFMGWRRSAYRVLVRKPRRGAHLEDLGVDWRIISKWVLSNRTGGMGMDLIDLARGNTGGMFL